MAKVGEGDERWIVKERSDGTNVAGWHWQEKDCLPWSKDRLSELMIGLHVEDKDRLCYINITSVDTVKGEAYVNIRKGKKIPGYEVEVKMTYEGEIREAPDGAVLEKATGRIDMPYLADENADEDPEIKIVALSTGSVDEKLREVMYSKGRKLVQEKINIWRSELAAGGPGGDGPAPEPTKKAEPAAAAAVPKEEKKPKAKATSGKTLKLTEKFFCRPADIYDSLTNPGRIMHFTQSKAEFDHKVGGKFMMFDGSIQGENLDLAPGEKLVQKWRFSTWSEEVFSTVTITFKEPEPGNTVVTLVQEGVPEEDKFGNHNVYDQTENGWKNLIFARIRSMFGYGC